MDKKEIEKYLDDYYKDHSTKLSKATDSHSTQLDKSILTIASGAILLTVAFYEKIVTQFNIDFSWLLKASWVSLLLSIFAVLTSYRFALIAFNKGRSKLDKWYEQILAATTNKPLNLKSVWAILAEICNYTAYFALIIGILFAVIFAWKSVNLQIPETEKSAINIE